MKHRKTRLTPLQKALLGKGFVASPHSFSRIQAEAFADAIDAKLPLEQAMAAARRAR